MKDGRGAIEGGGNEGGVGTKSFGVLARNFWEGEITYVHTWEQIAIAIALQAWAMPPKKGRLYELLSSQFFGIHSTWLTKGTSGISKNTKGHM